MTDPLDPDSQPEEEPKPESQESPPPVEEEAKPVATKSKGKLHFPAVGNGELAEKEEKKWAMMGHLLSLTGLVTYFGYVIGPLIPFFLKKGQSPFVDEHNRETLNFSILTFLIITVSSLGAVASVPVLGCFAPLIPAVFAIMNLIYCIQGAMAAKNGEAYRYPFNIRFIR